MIKVYVAHTDKLYNKEVFDSLYAQIPAERKARIDRMKQQEDKLLSLGSFILLKEAVKEKGIILERCELVYQDTGKPYLPEYPEISFNLSHSKERVMCAVGTCAVGCDVEKIKETDYKVAKRFFHEDEYAFLEACEEEKEKQRMFYRLWTAKESFVKMTGQGMRRSFQSFIADIPAQRVWDETKTAFYLQEYDLGDGYCYTCCSTGKAFATQMQQITF